MKSTLHSNLHIPYQVQPHKVHLFGLSLFYPSQVFISFDQQHDPEVILSNGTLGCSSHLFYLLESDLFSI